MACWRAVSGSFNTYVGDEIRKALEDGRNIVPCAKEPGYIGFYVGFTKNYRGFEKELDGKCASLRLQFPQLEKIIPNNRHGVTLFLNKTPGPVIQFLCAAIH